MATVTGKLPEGKGIIEVLKGSFPGGSITGAPKIRSMEIIEELEPVRRGIYTGSVSYTHLDVYKRQILPSMLTGKLLKKQNRG